jgi:hypothetical protein
MFRGRRRRSRVLAMVKSMNPKQRARFLRYLLYTGKEPDTVLLRDIAVMAVPGNENDAAIAKYAEALRAGRRIKVGTYPTRMIEIDGYDANLVYEVETSFPSETEGEVQ